MMRNDQNRELAKKQEEESFKERMDPVCPGCHQRMISQGCACGKPKPKPKPQPQPKSKTPDTTNEKNAANEDHKEINRVHYTQDKDDKNQNHSDKANKDSWIQEKDGSFTYLKPGFFSINVNDKNCTLFFSKNNPDFEKVYGALNQFELDNNLILNKDFKVIKNSDRLIISFSNPNLYEKFIDHLLNNKTGLSNELQSALRSLPKLEPKGAKKTNEEEKDNIEKKSAIKSPFRIPDPNQGPNPYDQ